MKYRSLTVSLGAVATALLLGACTEDVIFRDRELFVPPQAAAMGFIGYSDTATALPVCGNCHVGQNSKWKTTAHADAWATLDANPGQQAFCEGCHTVSALGNPVEGNAGYTAVAEGRYHDVQCESCHGPGLTHVTNPDADTKPIAPLDVALDLTTGCGECHNGTHHPFVEEWSESAHGSVPHQASPGSRAECQGCHTGEDALLTWGINALYAEKSQVEGSNTNHLPITCGVCHDPHSNRFEGQLRFPVDVPNEEQNLCMKCHHKRGTPDVTTFRGPHSPEGPVVLGYGGWWPPDLQLPGGDTAFATHGSSRNPQLCAGCHLVRFTVTDAQSGNHQFTATGHLFLATPCVDAQGIPQAGDCPDAQKTYRTCTASGCHGSENVARTLEAAAKLTVAQLADQLDQVLSRIHANWKTCRTNNSCGTGSPFNTGDGRYTTAEGAAFNWDLARFPVVSGTPNYATVVHNPVLIEALLVASINQVRKDYNLTLPPGVQLKTIEEVLRRQ